MMPLGMILAAPVATGVMRRIGSFALAAVSVSCAAICLLLIGLIRDPWAWMPLRLLIGLLLASLFIVTDTWVNQLAAEHARGRVLGFYSMLMSIGFALGPALLLVVETQGWAPFVAGSACGFLSLVPLLVFRTALPQPEGERRMSVLAFLPAAPVLLAGVTAAALADQGAMSMLPLFTLRYGMNVNGGNLALVIMIAGSIGLQYPVGWLADRVPRRALYLACALATAAGAALMPLAVQTPIVLWVLVFAWGGTYYAIYTLSLVRLGERFTGSVLVAGNAAFAAMWGVGGLLGQPLIGGAMQLWGPVGLPAVLVGLFTLLALVAAVSSERWR
jgi:MFS family permease